MPIDYKRYPRNWKNEIVPFIRNRSNDCCEFCGLQNGVNVVSIITSDKGRIWLSNFDIFKQDLRLSFPTYVELSWKNTKVILTVAHLLHDADNPQPLMNSLAHLCQLCHIKYDRLSKLELYFRDIIYAHSLPTCARLSNGLKMIVI